MMRMGTSIFGVPMKRVLEGQSEPSEATLGASDCQAGAQDDQNEGSEVTFGHQDGALDNQNHSKRISELVTSSSEVNFK